MSTQIAVVPREFRAVHDQLARWRRTRRPGMPIPAPLWAAIAAVARRHGATRTAHALGLDSHKGRQDKQPQEGGGDSQSGRKLDPFSR
jgi:hypothetical protein